MNAERQRKYRERKKQEIGIVEFKKQQAQKMREYRQKNSNSNVIFDSIEKRVNYNQIIKKISDRDTSGVSQITFERYLGIIKRLKRMSDPTDDNPFNFLREHEKVIKIIKEKYTNPNTLSSVFNAIAATLRRIPEFSDVYNDVYKDLNIQFSKSKKKIELDRENKLTEKEEKVYLPWRNILDLEDKILKEGDKENIAIFYLYTQIPPRRISDYNNLKIGGVRENYINPKDFSITINKYKTAKTYGQFKINPPPKLRKSLSDLIGDRLIPNSVRVPKGPLFSLNSKKMKTIFGVGVNILRHSFISDFLSKNPSQKKKLEIARQMAHSIETQAMYNRIK
jgi:hypothetical protein